MAFSILSPERVKALVSALTPWFVGREQDAIIEAMDVGADAAYDSAYDLVQPLFDFRSDIQSPAGADMVGILDAGGHFTGSTVEDALDELATLSGDLVIDSIANSDTTHAPSRNAVFDALALKVDTSTYTTDMALKAPLASPVFTGNPTAPTPTAGDNDTSIATTAYVQTAIAAKVDTSRTINTTAPLAGGGNLSANRTLSITAATTSAAGSMSAADKTKLDLVVSGTYTPTATNIANATAITPGAFSYSRNGNQVIVAGQVTLTPSASATLTQVELTLPIATDLVNNGDLAGTGVPAIGTPVPVYIHGVPATDRARFNYIANSTGSQSVYMQFCYLMP